MKAFVNIIRELTLSEANNRIENKCGIVDFFLSEDEKSDFISYWDECDCGVAEDRVSYGDWQTPHDLANKICKSHLERFGEPDILIEPTCGKGAFVLAALNLFSSLEEVYAVEINPSYVIELKANILFLSLIKPRDCPNPKIYIFTEDFFKFDFSAVFGQARNKQKKVAIIGNPPWVTISKQGLLMTKNIPDKNNLYHLKGLDALTGKSNFDISEAIVLSLLSYSKGCQGAISILLKNSVVRNLIIKQRQKPFSIFQIKQCHIDSKKEFNVSVEASCMIAQLGSQADEICEVIDFYSQEQIYSYGWIGDSFVSDLNAYTDSATYDGHCPYIWRSGVKHDCANILELELRDSVFYNKLGEIVNIENDLIYPLMKSSDIAKNESNIRKFILLPQRYIGEDISYIRTNLPKTYQYLINKKRYFDKRKSSIYKNKGSFSIFGVGDYTFMPFKIVVSSLYKKIQFVLIQPYNSKPVIVDDTCYQIGFNSKDDALMALEAFQSEEITRLIDVLSFTDSKRVVTKSLLMRLNINAVPCFSHKKMGGKWCQSSLFD